jgi:NAD(P) transhydrogenase subunit alpha
MPTHASFLYSRNIANFLGLLVKDGQLAPDFDDEIVAGTCVVRDGEVVHSPTAEALGLAPPATEPAAATPPTDQGSTDQAPTDSDGATESKETGS